MFVVRLLTRIATTAAGVFCELYYLTFNNTIQLASKRSSLELTLGILDSAFECIKIPVINL